MTVLSWDEPINRYFFAGIDRGVLYPKNGPAISWSGLLSISESDNVSTGAMYYVDGVQYRNSVVLGDYASSVSCYTYPPTLDEAKGPYDFSYRTSVGGAAEGHILHLVYNATFDIDDSRFATTGRAVAPTDFSWSITTRPIDIESLPSIRASSHLMIDSRTAYPWVIDALSEILYGTDKTDPRMPTPEELLVLFEINSLLRIVDNGDGTWTASAPDYILSMIDADTFQIDWPSANFIDATTYSVYSL